MPCYRHQSAFVHPPKVTRGFGRHLSTYFFPRQTLGPVEKGCRACFLSFANSLFSGSQRSGMNEYGSLKLFGLRYAARLVTKTFVC